MIGFIIAIGVIVLVIALAILMSALNFIRSILSLLFFWRKPEQRQNRPFTASNFGRRKPPAGNEVQDIDYEEVK